MKAKLGHMYKHKRNKCYAYLVYLKGTQLHMIAFSNHRDDLRTSPCDMGDGFISKTGEFLEDVWTDITGTNVGPGIADVVHKKGRS